VGKCLAFAMTPQAATFLNPKQLGVGTKGGCETAIHSTQALLDDITIPVNSKWGIKVDYTNAFNCVDRSKLIEEVRVKLPGISAFVESAYGSASVLFFGDQHFLSCQGVHQGDPLGPLLFALPSIHSSRESMQRFRTSY
jgi:hypothetical protein